jgi:hypothetical protein
MEITLASASRHWRVTSSVHNHPTGANTRRLNHWFRCSRHRGALLARNGGAGTTILRRPFSPSRTRCRLGSSDPELRRAAAGEPTQGSSVLPRLRWRGNFFENLWISQLNSTSIPCPPTSSSFLGLHTLARSLYCFSTYGCGLSDSVACSFACYSIVTISNRSVSRASPTREPL